jgi:hypothetical protein
MAVRAQGADAGDTVNIGCGTFVRKPSSEVFLPP